MAEVAEDPTPTLGVTEQGTAHTTQVTTSITTTTGPEPDQEPASVDTTFNATVAPEEAEPQNPLTQKFTEQEWSALKEFRKELPAMLQDAYEDPKASEAPISLWGVDIDPSRPNSDARVSVVLMKFLRARNLSIPETRDMFISTLRWRKIFDIETAMKEEFPQDVFGQLGHIYGKDKEGRTVVYNLYGANKNLKTVFGDVQRFLRWRIALHEKSILTLDFINVDQAIQIHDYEGVGLTSRDANSKAAASQATNIFANYYPELLYKKFFINVPTLFNWLFWVMKPLIPTNTLAKMSIVGTGRRAIANVLLPHIDTTQLPTRYGGEADAF